MKRLFLLLITIILVATLAGCGGGKKTESTAQNQQPEQKYPSKPIEVIVAYKAGGGTDVGARILTSAAEKVLGQPLVVVNIDGADGELGWTELVSRKPDGYTIGFINLPTFVSIPLQRETKFKKDSVAPILNHVFDPGVLVVRADSQWKTLEDFVKYAKENPEAIRISNNGTGASNHIGAAHLAKETGIKVTHVPFGGTADLLAALRGGHVEASVAKISEVARLVRSGELRALATYTKDRLEDFPDVPTLTEKGYKILFGSARALVAPKGTPEDIIKKLHDAFKTAIDSPDHKEKAKNSDLPIKYMGPKELAEYMDNDEKYIKEIVPSLGL